MAYRKRKSEFAGVGALVQLLGLILLFQIYLFPIGTIAAILILLIGSRLATKLICSDCGNKIEPSSLLCPTCKEPLTEPYITIRLPAFRASKVESEPQPKNPISRENKFYITAIAIIVVVVTVAAVLKNGGLFGESPNEANNEQQHLHEGETALSDDKNVSQPTDLSSSSEVTLQKADSEHADGKEAISSSPTNIKSSSPASALPAQAVELTESAPKERQQEQVDAETKLRIQRIVSDYAHTRGETEIEFAQRLNTTPVEIESWVYAYEKNGGTGERALQMRESYSKVMENPEKAKLASCLANAFDKPRPAGQSPDVSECDVIQRKIEGQ